MDPFARSLKFVANDTIYDAAVLRALKSWQDDHLNLADGTETKEIRKNKEKLNNKYRVAHKKRFGQ